MSLHATVRRRVGTLGIDLDLVAPAGSVTAVLGPNGAGKTSLMRCLAGTLPIDEGQITLAGTILDEPPRTFVVPEHRRVGLVHQDYLLFPHLSALDNVAFGPRSRGAGRRAARRSAADWLERVGMGTLADIRPGALSGGQAQRVALARALATDPAMLLLDEPLSALDARTRLEVRRDLRSHLSGFAGPTVLVTHDPVDALTLADHVAIIEAGRLTQTGTLVEVTTQPRSRYVADLFGTNLLAGTSAGHRLTTETGMVIIGTEAHDGPAFATVAPSAIALHRQEPEGSPRNRWRAKISHLDLMGDRIRVHLETPVGLVSEVTPAAAAQLELNEGDEVWASAKATEVVTYKR